MDAASTGIRLSTKRDLFQVPRQVTIDAKLRTESARNVEVIRGSRKRAISDIAEKIDEEADKECISRRDLEKLTLDCVTN